MRLLYGLMRQGADGKYLDACFRTSMSQLGVQSFLINKVSPFLAAWGESWVDGKIQIFHEHFASERLHSFLTSTWRPLADGAKGPNLICAALPGENHFLGLHMAATITALYGFRIIFLGPKTPLSDLVACTWQSDAQAILLSISATTDIPEAKKMIMELKSKVANAKIILGGQVHPSEGVLTISLSELQPGLSTHKEATFLVNQIRGSLTCLAPFLFLYCAGGHTRRCPLTFSMEKKKQPGIQTKAILFVNVASNVVTLVNMMIFETSQYKDKGPRS